MSQEPLSQQVFQLMRTGEPLYRFFTSSKWAARREADGISDFVAGNPQEEPPPGVVEALQRWSVPRSRDWYAYIDAAPGAKEAVVRSLRDRLGMSFEDDDVFLTNGAFAGLAVALKSVVDPGDEVLFLSPPWFFYQLMIESLGAKAVRVVAPPPAFDLDVDAIRGAITERTRAIVVNSPNNPTGRIYPPEVLRKLADVLDEASARNRRPIYLVSDESYSRILFDGNSFDSPTAYYRRSFLVYTYGKTLLSPGQRLGYLALPPSMPDRELMRGAVFLMVLALGYAFPSVLLQRALADLERLSIDLRHLQEKRDRMVAALRSLGYELNVPEGTFYLLPRAPIPDDLDFADILAGHDVFVLPGTLVELPGFFRISLTANDEMIDRAIPRFASAMEEALAGTRQGARTRA
ncbi:MAG TPA: aminotransferase class I/II-fold pyridoxal phosphate-dependent enzyme [Actinomycetota bacterium]|nr:aminotransferase class I/II-fold pyridoxal phosphate-dependent enzyme [Actinomycetota bacterium]